MKFEKNVIYIDNREGNNTKEFFNETMYKNTIKNDDGISLKKINGEYRLKLTGNKQLPYNGSKETSLPVGDYMWNGHVFELKRGFDLKDSVTGEIKRLDKQIDNAKKLLRNKTIESYQIFCTMEGGFTGDKFDEFNYFSSQPGIQVIQYYDLDHCFKAMFNTWNTVIRLTDLHPNYIPDWNPAIGVLYLCDNCTENIAKKIYNRFHPFYIDDLEKLTPSKLKEINGIGDIISDNLYNEIQEILHRPVNSSNSSFHGVGEVIVY